MKINKILLSHPYSGSLYAYFTEQITGRLADTMLENSYYKTLYGKNFRQYTDIALTLTLLYKEIIVASADNQRPNETEYPELGLTFDTDDSDNLYRTIKERVLRDIRDSSVNKILSKVPEHSRIQILRDTRMEMYLADKHKCPIICAGGRRNLIRRMIKLDNLSGDIGVIQESSLLMLEEYIELTGLLFNPKDIDVLHALKADKEVRSYANGFVTIMHNFREKKDVRRRLLLLIQESMNKAIVSNNIKGIFDVVTNFLGFFGVVSTNPAVSVADLSADVASRLANNYNTRQEWFQFGHEVKKFLSQAEIDLAIAKELNGIEKA